MGFIPKISLAKGAISTSKGKTVRPGTFMSTHHKHTFGFRKGPVVGNTRVKDSFTKSADHHPARGYIDSSGTHMKRTIHSRHTVDPVKAGAVVGGGTLAYKGAKHKSQDWKGLEPKTAKHLQTAIAGAGLAGTVAAGATRSPALVGVTAGSSMSASKIVDTQTKDARAKRKKTVPRPVGT